MLQHHPSQLSLQENEKALKLGSRDHKRYPITTPSVPGYPGAGMGRIVRFADPINLTEIIDRIGLGLGNPKGFPIAVPQGKQAGDMMIGSIGICAGSGGGLFAQMEKEGEDVDLYFTGELGHHEALAAIEKGKCVICLFHSNTERGFLHGVMKPALEETIREEVRFSFFSFFFFFFTSLPSVFGFGYYPSSPPLRAKANLLSPSSPSSGIASARPSARRAIPTNSTRRSTTTPSRSRLARSIGIPTVS